MFLKVPLRCCLASLLMMSCRPVEPPPPRAAPVPVLSETAAVGPFQGSITLIATSQPAATVELRAPATGRLRLADRDALATGRAVRGGELLFTVESPPLELAVREAELAKRAALSELERTRQGVDGGFLPEADLARQEIDHELSEERLAGAREELQRLRVVAPSSGTLRTPKAWADGARISVETPVAELALGGSPRALGWATASDLEQIEPGATALCLDSKGERVLGRGVVTATDRRLDSAGIAQVIARIDEDSGMPTAGSGVLLRVLKPAKESAISVPERALVIDGTLSSVFVLEAVGSEAVARARLVQVGARHEQRVEILDGLEGGEKVVTEGAELLADGLRVKDVTEADASSPQRVSR